MFFGEKGDKNREDPTKKLEESTEMELCFAKRCGSTLVHYGLLAQRGPHSTRLTPAHLPPRGRLWVVPFIIRKYNISSLYRVDRAFPEGEGGPGKARVG